MPTPYSVVIVAARVAAFPLALLFGQPAYCTAVSGAGAHEPGGHSVESVKPAVLGGTGGAAEPIAVDRQFPLSLDKSTDARLQTVSMTWRPVATAQFTSAGAEGAPGGRSASLNSEPVRTGPLTWAVSSNGTRILDTRTGQRATISTLTNSDVRPRDIVFNERRGIVWLSGETLYRYRIAERALERLQPSGEDFRAIRKAVSGPGGLWLATGNGAFLLDEEGGSLKKINHPAVDGVALINAAAAAGDVWLATAGARLIRITGVAPNQARLAVSAPLPGTPAEIVAAKQNLWMLLSDHHGDHYRLAFVDGGLNQVRMIAGKYFSLGEKDGQITASAYSTLFFMDPDGKTITRLKLSEAGLLAHASRNESVLFVGSSYGYKDGCEVVEHGQIDISKGWLSALGDLVFH